MVSVLAAELWIHAQIQVHHGKTQVWNRAGEEPAGIEELTARARCVDPDAVVWRGDVCLDPMMRGVKVLGAPIGSDEFVRAQLEDSAAEDSSRTGSPESVVAPPLLCSTTSQFPPAYGATLNVRSIHASPRQCVVDVFLSVGWDCWRIRKCSQGSWRPLVHGRAGTVSGCWECLSRHWASWADCIPSVKKRHPDVAEVMVSNLLHHDGQSFTAVRECVHTLREAQFEVPSWEAVWAGLRAGQSEDDENPVEPKHGWQKPAARATHEDRVARTIWPNLTSPERALWRSQKGPLACSAFTAFPTSRSTRIDPQPFQRRAWRPLVWTTLLRMARSIVEPLESERLVRF